MLAEKASVMLDSKRVKEDLFSYFDLNTKDGIIEASGKILT